MAARPGRSCRSHLLAEARGHAVAHENVGHHVLLADVVPGEGSSVGVGGKGVLGGIVCRTLAGQAGAPQEGCGGASGAAQAIALACLQPALQRALL